VARGLKRVTVLNHVRSGFCGAAKWHEPLSAGPSPRPKEPRSLSQVATAASAHSSSKSKVQVLSGDAKWHERRAQSEAKSHGEVAGAKRHGPLPLPRPPVARGLSLLRILRGSLKFKEWCSDQHLVFPCRHFRNFRHFYFTFTTFTLLYFTFATFGWCSLFSLFLGHFASLLLPH
jgi:hypothetical protein